MITGVVTADREAVIRLVVRGPGGREARTTAVVDTGFNGWLSLPRSLIERLRLPWRERESALLADGNESLFDIHEGRAIWDRGLRRIPIHAADATPLVGMSLLAGYELKVQVRVGGKVTIKSLPRRKSG